MTGAPKSKVAKSKPRTALAEAAWSLIGTIEAIHVAVECKEVALIRELEKAGHTREMYL